MKPECWLHNRDSWTVKDVHNIPGWTALILLTVTSRQPLSRLLETPFYKSREEICQLLIQIHAALSGMEEYLLDAGCPAGTGIYLCGSRIIPRPVCARSLVFRDDFQGKLRPPPAIIY